MGNRQLPKAWRYELAHAKNRATGVYEDWQWHTTDYLPMVPQHSIRNLEPLYPADGLPGWWEAMQTCRNLVERMMKLWIDESNDPKKSAGPYYRSRHRAAREILQELEQLQPPEGAQSNDSLATRIDKTLPGLDLSRPRESTEFTDFVDYCTSGPPEERYRQWVILFEDRDIGMMVFDKDQEAEAHRAWDRAKDSYTCTLFETSQRKYAWAAGALRDIQTNSVVRRDLREAGKDKQILSQMINGPIQTEIVVTRCGDTQPSRYYFNRIQTINYSCHTEPGKPKVHEFSFTERSDG